MALIVIRAAETTREIPADPVVFGALAFGVLMVMLLALLVFGKGRPHS